MSSRRASSVGFLTWANGVTSLRLLAAPCFYCALSQGAPLLAFGLFWLAVVTDLVDGRLARARGETSSFGGILDHATDASFVSLGLYALAVRGIVSLALPIVVVAAFVQYVADSRLLRGNALRASFIGRWNGILYFVPLGIVASRDALALEFPPNALIGIFGWVLVFSTVLSMIDRATALLRLRRTPGANEGPASE